MRNTVPLHTSLHTALPHCFVAHFSTERCELLNGWGAPGGDAWELLLPGKQQKMQEAVADQEEEAVRLQLQPEEEPQEERCQG